MIHADNVTGYRSSGRRKPPITSVRSSPPDEPVQVAQRPSVHLSSSLEKPVTYLYGSVPVAVIIREHPGSRRYDSSWRSLAMCGNDKLKKLIECACAKTADEAVE